MDGYRIYRTIVISSTRRSRPGWRRCHERSICGQNVRRLKTRASLVVALLMLWSAHSSSWNLKTARKFSDLSRLFLYYNERVIEGTVDHDSGAFIRDGIKSLAKQGVCTEPEWPYKISRFTKKPSRGLLSQQRKSIAYSRITELARWMRCVAAWPKGFRLSLASPFTTLSNRPRWQSRAC